MSTDLPVNPAPLPPAIAEAIARAAVRISDRTVENEGCRAISDTRAEQIITEELRSVLLGGPLGTVTAATPGPLGTGNWSVGPFLITLPTGDALAGLLDRGRGCIGTRYCHACKVSYGGTCLCAPIKCHHCGAECGTTPPAEGENYRHETHY